MATENYHCAQNVLYSILELAWDYYDLHLARFAAYKGSYTNATSAAGRLLIETAELLPDENQRGEQAETLRIELVPLGRVCTQNYQKLKGYIRSAFAENVWKPKFEAAGQPYFKAASNDDWEQVKALNTAMKGYITANSATLQIDLQSGGVNMPVTFPGVVITASDAFEVKYTAFKL